MSCQEAPDSLFVNPSTTVFPKESQSLFLQLRRTLGSKVKEYKAALQHVREGEDLQKKEQEVMSTVYITVVPHNQAALQRHCFVASSEQSGVRYIFFSHLSRFALSCPGTTVTCFQMCDVYFLQLLMYKGHFIA